LADLNNLNLNPSYTVDVDFNNMPTGIGATFAEPPQPGTFLFRLPPSEVIFSAFEKLIDPTQGERIVVVLKEAAALFNETLKQPYPTRFTNVVRYLTRTIDGEKKQVAISDMAMVLKAVDSIPDSPSNAAYVNAMIKAGGRQFLADNTLTATCSPTKDTYHHNPNTGRSELRAGVKGCGQKFKVEGYSPKDGGKPVLSIPRDEEGKVALRFTCTCGAELRSWPQLQGFRPAS
jgi:hypothetical protein